MLKTSESIKALAGALAKAQATMGHAARSSTNPHFKNTYADLAEVLGTVRAAFGPHGLSVWQSPGLILEGEVELTTRIMHESGEWIEDTMRCPVGKRDAQGVGGAITYARRYALSAACGVAQADDDGNTAVGAPAAAAPAAKRADAPGLTEDLALSVLAGVKTLDELAKAAARIPDNEKTPAVREAYRAARARLT